MAALLRRLIGCDTVTLTFIEPSGSIGHQRTWVGDEAGAETELTAARWVEHPLRRHLAQHGTSRAPFRVAGPGDRQQPVDTLVLPIQPAGQRVVCWTLTRSAARFGPQDLWIAELVMPGLRATVTRAQRAAPT